MVIDESLAMLRKAVEYGKLKEEEYKKIVQEAGKDG